MITWFVPANNCSVVIRFGVSALATTDLTSELFIMTALEFVVLTMNRQSLANALIKVNSVDGEQLTTEDGLISD
jgi:hypothetical protein